MPTALSRHRSIERWRQPFTIMGLRQAFVALESSNPVGTPSVFPFDLKVRMSCGTTSFGVKRDTALCESETIVLCAEKRICLLCVLDCRGNEAVGVFEKAQACVRGP